MANSIPRTLPTATPADLLPHADAAALLLRALANPQRLLILCNLAGGEMSVSELNARLPLSQMVAASLSVGVAAKISTSAGEYVCNHVLYSLLNNNPGLRCGFIHLQSTDVFLGVEAMLKVASLPIRK
jgi:pyrrolidone-carboxylate peptidase